MTGPGRVALRWTTVVAAFSVFVVSARLVLRAVAATLNSDSLYLAGLYRDLFVDRVTLSGWYTQPAPSFFPDAPVYFAARALTGHPVAAIEAYAAVLLVLGVLSIVALARTLDVEDPWETLAVALASIGAFAYFASFGDFYHQLLLPSCHGSGAWVELGSALLIARQLKHAKVGPIAALGVLLLTALTGASDHLYLLHAAGLAVGLVFCLVFVEGARRIAAFNLVAIWLGVRLAPVLEAIPPKLGVLVEPYPPTVEMSWKRVASVLAGLPPPDDEPFVRRLVATVFLLAVIACFAACAIAAAGLSPRRRPRSAPLAFLAASFLGTVVCVVCGIAFSGAWWNAWCARYLSGPLLLPFVVVPVAWLAAPRRLHRVLVVAALASVPALATWPVTSAGLKGALAVRPDYPPAVACADRLATRISARFGYGDYWTAGKTTELSRHGLHVLAVNQSFGVYDRIVNRSWYRRAVGTPSFVVLLDKLGAGATRARFGEPTDEDACDGQAVWGYRSPPRSPVLP